MPNYTALLKVGTENILDGSITTEKLADGCITTSKLADASVNTSKLADASVITSKLADASVNTSKLADASVTTSKLANASVDTSKLADASVTTSKLADASVTTSKIADASIISDKLNVDFLVYEGVSANPLDCEYQITFNDLPSGHWIGFLNFSTYLNRTTGQNTIFVSSDVESKERDYIDFTETSDRVPHTFIYYFDIDIQNGTLTINTTKRGIWSLLLIRISGLEQS